MLIEQLRRHPLFQITWTVVLLVALGVVFLKYDPPQLNSISPFLSEEFMPVTTIWHKLVIYVFSFLLLFISLFQLSSLLRNYHFTGDSRFDMLFLLLPFLLLFPSLLFHIELALFIYFLQRALQLLFSIHTQIRINREISLMAVYMSLASLLFPFALVIALILYLGILVQRGFYIRELLIYLILLGLPFYFISALIYLFDLPFLYSFNFDFHLPELNSWNAFEIFRGGFVLIFIYFFLKSFLLNSKAVLRSKAQFRNYYGLTLIGAFVFLFNNETEGVALFFLPFFAIFGSTYPELRKKWVFESLLILLSVVAILQYLIE